MHLKEIPLIGTNFWMCYIPNESCAFETSVTEWQYMIQKMNCIQLLSVKLEEYPSPALHHGRGFIRNRASNQRHLKSSSFWMAVVFNKRTLWGGWLVLMSYLICCIRALLPRDCPPLSPPFACSATPARSSHHFPPKQNLIVFYPVSLLSNSFYSFRSGSTD